MSRDQHEQKTAKNPEEQPSPSRNLPHVLLSEDNDEMRALLTLTLRKEGYQVTECVDGPGLLDTLRSCLAPHGQKHCDLVISDIKMPFVSGLEVLEIMHEWEEFPPMILITAFGDEETHAQAVRLGASAVLDKPFEIDDLLAKVREILSPQPPNSTACEEPGVIVGDTADQVLRIEKTIKADLNAVSPIIDRIAQITTDVGWASGKRLAVLRALREALTNAIVHGCKMDNKKRVQFWVSSDRSGNVLTVVRDPGPGFDSKLISTLMMDKGKHSAPGKGIFLINQLMDRVWFENGGREIHMEIGNNQKTPKKVIDGILGSIIDEWYENVSSFYFTHEHNDGEIADQRQEELKRFHDKHGHRIKFDTGDLDVTYGLRSLWEQQKFIIEMSINNKTAGFDHEDFLRQLGSVYGKLQREEVPTPSGLNPHSYGEVLRVELSLFIVERRQSKANLMRIPYFVSSRFLEELTLHQIATKKLIESYCVSPFRTVYARVLRR